MANSKYEYVKLFEVDDELMLPNLLVVKIGGRNFRRFSEAHEFEKPNDEKALQLMNSCAIAVLEKYPDIVFSYGFSDEYSFVFKKTTKFYQRRSSKIVSLIVSFFTSVYSIKWKEYFPLKELRYPPSFHARVICCPTIEVLQEYLAWRQEYCHINNLYNTCFWMLVKDGKTESEAQKRLKDTTKRDINELLFKEFGINYTNLPDMFRQGSCVLKTTSSKKSKRKKTKVESIVKCSENGTPNKKMQGKVEVLHSKKIAGGTFWKGHSSVLEEELGHFGEDINIIKPEYIRSFQSGNKLMPFTWIVVRIDGCHFHRFSDDHKFAKPNDEQALNLMNSCAVAVLEEFQDIIFSYGVSDEYSFVLKKDSQFYQRSASEIVTVIVSFFTALYVMKWKEVFPQKELKYPPSFDGRAVCYPSNEILRDYLSWRQVDCHINNQFNTLFWMLVKSGTSKSAAQNELKGTQAEEKYEKLLQNFGIDYAKLPIMFRQGSSVFREEDDDIMVSENGATVEKPAKKVVIEHCNIIDDNFWKEHPSILDEKP